MTEKKRTAARKPSFAEAVQEVEAILQRLEDDSVDIDLLGQEVKRAVELIQICREKLAKTDTEVRELVSGLQGGPAEGKGPDAAGGAGGEAPF